MQAEEVAAFVNHHFSIVVQCIENEEGTVDKFMGDAVMAFWQNSEKQGHGAERALPCGAGYFCCNTTG